MKLTFAIIALFAAIVPLNGCLTLYRYRDVTFKLIDAETAKPIEAATLSVSYASDFEFHPPKSIEAITSPDGMVTVGAANFHGEFELSATAENYIWLLGQRATIREHPGYDKFRRIVLPGTAVNTIALFAKPKPNGTIFLPQGFQGLLRYPSESQSDIDQRPGQRKFTIRVGNDGIVRLPSSGVAAYTEWDLRYPDNTLIPKGDPLSKDTQPKTARYWIGISDSGLLEYIGDHATARATHIFVNHVTFLEGGGSQSEGDTHRANQVWDNGMSVIPNLP